MNKMPKGIYLHKHTPRPKGFKMSEEQKKKIGESNKGVTRILPKGDKSHAWRGGLTPINKILRTSREYKLWRKSVFERDNYICRFCGQRGGELNADHIKPFAYFPELRFAIDNGRTLCIGCHRKTDTYGVNKSDKY